MGQYFMIVNESKKQFIEISDLGENNKFGYVGQGLNGIALGRLLTSSGADWQDDFYAEFGHPEKDFLHMGAWAGDKIVIAGDYDLADTNGIKTSTPDTPNFNLYSKAEDEYEDITDRVIGWLANNIQTSEMLAERAKRDSDLLKKLSDLVFVNQNQQMKESLENIIGKDWTKLLKK